MRRLAGLPGVRTACALFLPNTGERGTANLWTDAAAARHARHLAELLALFRDPAQPRRGWFSRNIDGTWVDETPTAWRPVLPDGPAAT
jgi:hypothetical protein